MRLHLLFLLLLVSQSFSFSRPFLNSTWVDQNPNIYYGIYWNLPSFDRTLNSINLDLFSDPAFSTSLLREKYQSLLMQKQIALDKSHRCQVAISPFFQTSPFDLFVYSSQSTKLINLILSFPDCLDYSSHFNLALDQSLSILEVAKSDSQKSISSANTAYEKLVHAGICSSHYSGVGSEECEKMFLTFQTSVSEPIFGKPYVLEQLDFEIESQLQNSEPILSPFSSYLQLVYSDDGIVSYYSNLTKIANSSFSKAQSNQKSLQFLADSKLIAAKNKLNYYQSQKVNLILYGGSSDFAINQKYSQLSRHIDEVESNLSLSKSLSSASWQTNYLSDSILILDSSVSKLDQILVDFDSLSDSASSAILQAKEEARFEISIASELENTLNPDGKKSLELSKSLFSKGDSSSVLGESFQFYFDSAKYARIAKTQTLSASINSSLTQSDIFDLINRAKSDGLDVSSELALMDLYLVSQDPQIPHLVRSMIFEKANSSLSAPLLIKRNNLLNLMSALGPLSSDFALDLSTLDDGYFDGSQYDLEKTLGHFSFLRAQYADLESTLLNFSKEIITNSLSKKSSTYFDYISVSSKSNASIMFTLTNSFNLSSSNVSSLVELDYPVHFGKDDFSLGKNRIASTYLSGDYLVLNLYSVSQFDSIDFESKKEVEVVKLIKVSNASTGFSDGSATVESSHVVDVLSKIPRLDFPKQKGPFEKGRYNFSQVTYINSSYSYSLSDASIFPIGQKARLEFDVRLTPEIDLSSLSLTIPLSNSSSVSKFSVLSFGEGKLDSYLHDRNLLHLKLKNLKSSKLLIVRVNFEVDNSQNYSQSLLHSLPLMTNSSYLSPLLSSLILRANEEHQNGNFTGSIALSQKALVEFDKFQKEKLKTEKDFLTTRRSIDAELFDISSALDSFGSNSTFSKKLEMRTQTLRSLLDSNSSSYDHNWLDSELVSKSKEFSKDYSSLQKDSSKFNDSLLSSTLSDLDSALLRFETSRDLISALIVDDLISKSRSIVDSLKSSKNPNSNKEIYEIFSSNSQKTLSAYKSQKSLAKNTPYSSLFSVDETSFSSDLKDLRNYLDSDYRIFQYKINSLNSSLSLMSSQLSLLKNTANSKLSLISSKIPPERLSSITSLIHSSNYIGALKEIDKFIESQSSSKNSDLSSPYLLMGSVSLVALILIYLIMTKYKKPESPKPPTHLEKLDSDDSSDF